MLVLIFKELLRITNTKLTVYSTSNSTTEASIHTCIANKYKLIRTIHQTVEIEVKRVKSELKRRSYDLNKISFSEIID